MNIALINILDTINRLLAILIVVMGFLAGLGGGFNAGHGFIGMILGTIGGVIAAAVICGLLATLIEIHKNLLKLVVLQEEQYLKPDVKA